MGTVWLLALLISATLYVASAQGEWVAKTKYEQEQCTTNLKGCSLNIVGSKLSLNAGEKGDKGDSCIYGPKGEKGDPGNDGSTGPSGERGFLGSPGEKGNKGLRGETGLKGDKGQKGHVGELGSQGHKGDTGEKGSDGPVGPPGRPGYSGSCPCYAPTRNDKGDSKGEPVGSYINPALVVCKSLEKIDTGYIYMGIVRELVTCNVTKNEKNEDVKWTCIPPNKRNITKGDNVIEKEPFWMSTKKVTFDNIYNRTHDYLMWVQERSTKAYQKIRYYCKNSMLSNSTEDGTSLLMLSWNDVVFGPTPTASTPFTYEVLGNDGCTLPPTGESRSSEIIIRSDVAQRLPVVDFLVRDLRDSIEDIGVEHLELCFN